MKVRIYFSDTKYWQLNVFSIYVYGGDIFEFLSRKFLQKEDSISLTCDGQPLNDESIIVWAYIYL